MSIETECPGCGRKLHVEPRYAGRQARCPVCGTIYSVPGEEEPIAGDADPAAELAWRMRTPEGRMYGPVAKSELDRWVAEGRVTADCELLAKDSHDWRSADLVYPVLRSPAPRQDEGEPDTRYRYTAPHRGLLILVLGVLGWVTLCPPFGIIAWVMGSSDMNEMRAGRMDPGGRGLTQAGTILGMVQSILLIAAVVLIVFGILARVAVRG